MSFSLFDFIPSSVPTASMPALPPLTNTIITTELARAISSPRTSRQMAEDNLAAVHLLLELRELPDHRLSDEERLALLHYQGWGVAAELFMDAPPPQCAKSHELRHLNLTQLRQVILTNFGR